MTAMVGEQWYAAPGGAAGVMAMSKKNADSGGGARSAPRGARGSKSEISGAHPRLGEIARELSGNTTARALARRAGVSYDTVSRIWNGERPKMDTLAQFARGLRLDIAATAELMAAAGYGWAPPAPVVQPSTGNPGDGSSMAQDTQVRDAAGRTWNIVHQLSDAQLVLTPEVARILAAIGLLEEVQ